MSFDIEWEAIYTADEAEKDLGNGFEFRGCGWYIEKNGATLLVCPKTPEDPWNQDRETARMYIYFTRNPASWFNVIVNAPTRKDDR